MSHTKQPNTILPVQESDPVNTLPKPPFVEPKLTWIEPTLHQQGTLTAVAQTGGFFGSFSP